jgi:amino-acid N-acetyltransferase
MVTAERFETLRTAEIEDVGGILELIAPLEEQGILVRRSREQLELEMDHFMIAERDGMIIGCAALYPYPEEQLGELACLAIHPDYQRAGRGEELLRAVERRARELQLSRVLVLTTQTAHWFRERGFEPAKIADLPMERQSLYNYRRNSKVFIKTLDNGR